MSKNGTKKAVEFCTPEQRRLATQFVERILDINNIIGATDCGSGFDDVLQHINGEYKHAVREYLESRNRYGDVDRSGPLYSARVSETQKTGFILNSWDVMKNGLLREQAKSKDYLFAVNGRGAIGYEVVKLGKSCATLKVYMDISYAYGNNHDEEPSRYFQHIDVNVASNFADAFQCDYCDRPAKDLFVSAMEPVFGCIPCQTGLDSEQLEIYQRTVKAQASRKRGAA